MTETIILIVLILVTGFHWWLGWATIRDGNPYGMFFWVIATGWTIMALVFWLESMKMGLLCFGS